MVDLLRARLSPAGRTSGLVEHTRWLFFLCLLASMALTLPAPLLGPPVPGLLALTAAGTLLATWTWRYRSRSAPPLADLAEALGLTALATACPVPAMAFSVLFPALWFRGLYGSTRSVYLACGALTAGISLSLPLWPLVPGRDGPLDTPAATVLGTIPVVLLTAAVARHLATGLFVREEAQRRDSILVGLGTQLLGVTDREEVYRLAWQAAGGICAATPGLRALVVVRSPAGLEVVGTAGDLAAAPAALPVDAVPQLPQTAPPTPFGSDDLDRAVGGPTAWVAMPLPQQPEGTMVLGSPGRVTPDALVAIQSMMNQVALALRNSATHEHLSTQASTDSLTGLANRAAFTEALEAVLRRPGATPALLFLDLDDFKVVNDGFGHAAGDLLLRTVAARMRTAVRAEDLCARLGGDEFAVLLVDPEPHTALAVAERLVELVAQPVQLAGSTGVVGASIGVAPAGPGACAEVLLQQADVAMYAAKALGKNRVQLFEPTLPGGTAARGEAAAPGSSRAHPPR